MNLLQKLEAEQAAGWPSPPLTSPSPALRRLLAVLQHLMAEDETRHRQVHSDASRRNARRQWANMGQIRGT